MPDFQKAKIYRVVNDINNMTYYGSTCSPLSTRMSKHRWSYNNNENKTYLQFGQISDCKIFLIENFPCNSKEELRQRERFYIENNPCINKQTPGLTRLESKKKHYINNRQSILAKANIKHSCPCGGKFTQVHKSRHLKTIKHIKYCQSLLV